MNKKIICILCPVGCIMEVKESSEGSMNISGNQCPKGRGYAESECIAPVRTLTTTVHTMDGGRLPVKSAKPLPKEKLTEYAALLRRVTVTAPVRIGDVVLRDIGGSGVDIIAAKMYHV